MKKQQEVGKKLEKIVCEIAYKKGYFSHNIKNGINGQPFDIVLVKKDKVFLIDTKNVIKGKTFYFKRIENNQWLSMKLLNDKEFYNVGFVINFEEYKSLKVLFFKDIIEENKKILLEDELLKDFESIL